MYVLLTDRPTNHPTDGHEDSWGSYTSNKFILTGKFYLEWDLRFQGLDDFMLIGTVYLDWDFQGLDIYVDWESLFQL